MKTRLKIYWFICDYIEKKGYSPTYKEIMKNCNISSTNVVAHHINQLKKVGYITMKKWSPRSIQINMKKF